LCAVWLLLVWMVSVTDVAALPAGIVAGEKVAVAPEGNPDAVKVTASGYVALPLGENVRVKVAAAPGATVAVPEVDPVPEVSAKPAATVKLVVAVAAA
jgi:hypothetical protein